jgi:hypothetical protein
LGGEDIPEHPIRDVKSLSLAEPIQTGILDVFINVSICIACPLEDKGEFVTVDVVKIYRPIGDIAPLILNLYTR